VNHRSTRLSDLYTNSVLRNKY